MLRTQDAAAWAAEHGEWLFHTVREDENLAAIWANGLRPRKCTGLPSNDRFHPSSEDHVYLATNAEPQTLRNSGVGSKPPQIKVRLDHLNLELLEADEDCLGVYKTSSAPGIIIPTRDELSGLPDASRLDWPAT